MTTEAKVSVVVPVLNGERHIADCVRSILRQKMSNFEVIIADNASTDRTLEIVKSFEDPRVTILDPPGKRLSLHENWARALSSGVGDLVKLVCHDDVLLPDCLEIQSQLLENYPNAVLAGCRRRIIDDHDQVLIRARGLGNLTGSSGTQVLGGSSIAHACVRAGANLLGEPASILIRRSSFRAPLFDPKWHYTIDVEFYLRCLGTRDAVLDDRVLCCFRVSPDQLSASLATGQANELRQFFAELAMRYPEHVSPMDVRIGTIRARALAFARRALYQQMRLRSALSRRDAKAGATRLDSADAVTVEPS